MITHVGTTTIYVSDQDRALDFYVKKLGFERRRDEPMGPGAPRWIEVAPKGAQTSVILYLPTEQMPGAGTYEAAKSLVGKFSTFMLEVDDMQAVYKELSSRGVEFVDVPKKAFSGWWATVKDSEGNSIDLHQ